MPSFLSSLASSWAVVASDPRAVVAASIGVLALMGFVATYLPVPRRSAKLAGGEGLAPMVARLADTGATADEIARRMRLSHDAVATILRGRPAGTAAPVRPVPAGFARRWRTH